MPITPFHFGPAVAAKAISPGYFSFLVFGFTQLVIDAEPAYFIARGDWPIHRFFHTYLGATVAAVFAVALGRPLGELVIGVWNRRLRPSLRSRLEVAPRIPLIAAASGAFLGAYSHILLDSVMHSDIRPFSPWSDRNGVLGLMSIGQLYLLCSGFALLGGILKLLVLSRRRVTANKRA